MTVSTDWVVVTSMGNALKSISRGKLDSVRLAKAIFYLYDRKEDISDSWAAIDSCRRHFQTEEGATLAYEMLKEALERGQKEGRVIYRSGGGDFDELNQLLARHGLPEFNRRGSFRCFYVIYIVAQKDGFPLRVI